MNRQALTALLQGVGRLFATSSVLTALFALSGMRSAVAAATGVESVYIHSYWLGLPGQVRQYDVVVKRKGGSFISDGQTVEGSKVEALRLAMTAPRMPTPEAEYLGLTRLVLANTAEVAFDSYIGNAGGEGDGFFTTEQRSLFLSSFKKPAVVSAALSRYYLAANHWEDDDPEIGVEVHLTDGSAISAKSASQNALMLPWTVQASGSPQRSFNPAISLAVRSLLPSSALNASRLSKQTLSSALPGIVGSFIAEEFQRLPRFDTAKTVSVLESRYQVHISHGGSQTTSDSHLAWNARLTWNDLPRNVEAVVSLPIIDNTIRNVEAIPAARSYATQALAIPWLEIFLDQHVDASADVLIEGDSPISFRGPDKERFVRDMTSIGRAALLDDISEQAAFFVQLDQPKTFSTWLVLPSQYMILWGYYPNTLSVAGHDATKLNGKPCEGMICVGRKFDRDGAPYDGISL